MKHWAVVVMILALLTGGCTGRGKTLTPDDIADDSRRLSPVWLDVWGTDFPDDRLK